MPTNNRPVPATGHVVREGDGLRIDQFIMGVGPDVEVVHLDGNPLNCLRENLCPLTAAEMADLRIEVADSQDEDAIANGAACGGAVLSYEEHWEAAVSQLRKRLCTPQ